MAGTRNR